MSTAGVVSELTEVRLPILAEGMENGTIVRWIKGEGDEVGRREELAEIEVDKATMIYESPAAGFLHQITREGETVAVGEVIAELRPDRRPPGAGAAVPAPDDARADTERSESRPVQRLRASPLARRLARESGLDMARIVGSGRDGRVVKGDVVAALTQGRPLEASAPIKVTPVGPAAGPPLKGEVTNVELTRSQRLIARRMAEAKATVPEFTVSTQADVESLLAMREKLRDGELSPVSVNDFVIKAAALALVEHPRFNGSYREGALELYSRVNVGMAVAAPNSLLVPVIFDADQKSIGQIGRESRGLADRVRGAQITPPELTGATFTVSNLGMYGVTHFTAIINKPEAAILAVGGIVARPIANRKGKLRLRRMIDMTLAADHRVVHGADAARFLSTIRAGLEHPLRLVVDVPTS